MKEKSCFSEGYTTACSYESFFLFVKICLYVSYQSFNEFTVKMSYRSRKYHRLNCRLIMRRYLFKMAIPYDRQRRKRGPWRSYFRALKMPLLVWTACWPSSQVLHIKFLVQNSIAPLGIFSDQLSFSPPKTIRACLHKVPLKKLVDEPVDAKLFLPQLEW